MKKLVLVLVFSFFFFPASVESKIGVGVGTGKIEVQDKLKPGMIYELPSLTVLNTGDEPSDYEAAVTYHQDQTQLTPPGEWFSFSPQRFYLEPGGAQQVAIKLNLPVKAPPGDYFAYLEGHPLKKAESGETRVGVAAAAKLYFTVLPANPVLGVYYKAISFWKINQPWTNRVAVGLAIVILYWGMKRYLGFQIGFAKKETRKEAEEKKEDE